MAWVWAQHERSHELIDLDRFLIWLSADTRCYFAVREFAYSDWSFFSGNAGHALDANFKLTAQANEAAAQTDYLTTVKDANGLMLCMLPSFQKARFIRIYIDDDYPTTLYELNPTTYRYVADSPVDGHTMVPISSNWAYDYVIDAKNFALCVGTM